MLKLFDEFFLCSECFCSSYVLNNILLLYAKHFHKNFLPNIFFNLLSSYLMNFSTSSMFKIHLQAMYFHNFFLFLLSQIFPLTKVQLFVLNLIFTGDIVKRRPLFAFIQRRLIFGQNYAKVLDNIRSNFRTKLGPIWSFTWYSLWFVCARTTR